MSFLDKAKAKIDAAIHPERHNATGTTGSTNAGPHDSNLANKADPRVDSDLDGGRHAGLNQTTGTTGTTGLTGTTGTGIGGTHGSTNAGPHSSNLLNKADPRVDSDLDGGRNVGLNQTTGPTGSTGLTGSHHNTTGTGLTGTHHTTGTGLTGSHNTTGTGLTGTHHTTGTGLTGSHNTTGTGLTGSSGANTTAGPHSSDLANKLDPRVDSDLSGGHLGSNAQYTHTGTTGSSGITGSTGTTGTYGSTGTHGSTNAGPHSSNFANAADPRVDSDLDGSRNAGLNQTTHTHGHTGYDGTTTGTSTQPVHNSSLLNKLDPRVNTGSGTTGSSTTY